MRDKCINKNLCMRKTIHFISGTNPGYELSASKAMARRTLAEKSQYIKSSANPTKGKNQEPELGLEAKNSNSLPRAVHYE